MYEVCAGSTLELSVLAVGVGEAFELNLIEIVEKIRLHRGQLDRLVCEGSVEITHIQRIFLQKVVNIEFSEFYFSPVLVYTAGRSSCSPV